MMWLLTHLMGLKSIPRLRINNCAPSIFAVLANNAFGAFVAAGILACRKAGS